MAELLEKIVAFDDIDCDKVRYIDRGRLVRCENCCMNFPNEDEYGSFICTRLSMKVYPDNYCCWGETYEESEKALEENPPKLKKADLNEVDEEPVINKENYVVIRYWTKSGEYKDYRIDFAEAQAAKTFNLNKWCYDRISHECGFFPYGNGGLISFDAILRIELAKKNFYFGEG